MQIITNLMQSDSFLQVLFIMNILLAIGFVINTINFFKIKKENRDLNKIIGKGTDIKEDLRLYLNRVEEVENKTDSIINYCKNIEDNMSLCIQKIGIVRYSAFRDTGSDLSFALALLDKDNNGVVLNGIYSREMSNIYAKPVKNGDSPYTLSEEENDALKIAINYKGGNKSENRSTN